VQALLGRVAEPSEGTTLKTARHLQTMDLAELRHEHMSGALVRVSEVLSYIDNERLMDKDSLAQFLGISKRKLNGLIPSIPHYRIGRELRFRKREVLEWLERYRERAAILDLSQIGESVKARLRWRPRRSPGRSPAAGTRTGVNSSRSKRGDTAGARLGTHTRAPHIFLRQRNENGP
jgi:excisionase family DNA binding protein